MESRKDATSASSEPLTGGKTDKQAAANKYSLTRTRSTKSQESAHSGRGRRSGSVSAEKAEVHGPPSSSKTFNKQKLRPAYEKEVFLLLSLVYLT